MGSATLQPPQPKTARREPEPSTARSSVAATRRLTGRRKWALRFVLLVLSPVVFFAVVEIGLRLAGYGHSTDFFKPVDTGHSVDTGSVYTANEKFAWQFYSRKIAKEPFPFRMSAAKPAGTYRIFILGSSAAWGTPSPSFNFGRILEVMLRDRFPEVKFEVINTAIMGTNSHIVRPIAQDCTRFDPDLFLVYLGNNEVVGLHGPKTGKTDHMPSLPLIRASLWAKSTRLGQLIGATIRGDSDSDGGPSKPQDAEYFLNCRVAADDPQRLAVYQNFRANLEDICEAADGCRAETLLSTVAVNLKDCPPVASLHRDDLTDSQKADWEAAYREGVEAETVEQHEWALPHYETALAIDDRFADLHFRLAQCYSAMGRVDDAREHYVLARDLDGLQFRADTPINDAICDVAKAKQQQAVELVDAQRALAECDSSDQGVPGRALFYEHVHMTFAGNYEVAKAFFPAVARAVSRRLAKAEDADVAVTSREECAERLGLTPWREYELAMPMVQLTSRPPFTAQLDHRQRQRLAVRTLERQARALGPNDLQHAIDTYRHALERSPDDWVLHGDLAQLLDRAGDRQDAADHLRIVLDTIPWHLPAKVALGHVLANLDKDDEAIAIYCEVLAEDPDQLDVHKAMAYVLGKQENYDRAIHHCREALRIEPDDADTKERLDTLMRRTEEPSPRLAGMGL